MSYGKDRIGKNTRTVSNSLRAQLCWFRCLDTWESASIENRSCFGREVYPSKFRRHQQIKRQQKSTCCYDRKDFGNWDVALQFLSIGSSWISAFYNSLNVVPGVESRFGYEFVPQIRPFFSRSKRKCLNSF